MEGEGEWGERDRDEIEGRGKRGEEEREEGVRGEIEINIREKENHINMKISVLKYSLYMYKVSKGLWFCLR